jgi:poly(3-hydroxybutyrate) depolymerase
LKPPLPHFIALVTLATATLTTLHAQQVQQSPRGFDSPRTNISHGKIDTIMYNSKTVGVSRKALVYTPPGFSKKKKYPVLYLLHGIGGDKKEWLNGWKPQVILDNLDGWENFSERCSSRLSILDPQSPNKPTL